MHFKFQSSDLIRILETTTCKWVATCKKAGSGLASWHYQARRGTDSSPLRVESAKELEVSSSLL